MDGGIPVPAPKKGIEETQDVIQCAGLVADKLGEVLADGKASAMEILTSMVALAGPLKEAVDGALGIKDELKDLDKDEVAALCAEMYVVIGKFAAAFGAK